MSDENALLRLLLLTDGSLLRPEGQQGSASTPDDPGRVWGLYFAAAWCDPCRTFTEKLKEFHWNLRKTDQRLDIVFVSSDESEEAFKAYFQKMPWMALPYSDRTKALQLSRILRTRSIPTLVLVDGATGHVITRHGREHVTADPMGQGFPWRPLTLESVLKRGPLVDALGESRTLSQLDGHVKGLYFSANWCPPCKAFTPQLAETYAKVKAKDQKMEVIFISSDRSQESFDQYFGSMPWLAIPYADEKWRKDVAELLGVQGIPTLVILDETNRIITRDGRYEVIEDPEGNNFPWKPSAVEVLTDKHSSKLNEDPFLILFTEGGDKDLEQARAMLIPVAERLTSEQEQPPLWFFVGGEVEICESLREFAQLEDEVPLLVILDMANGEKYVLDDDVELNEDVVGSFVRRFLDGEIEPQTFRQ